jgi:hypothetical protein
MQAKAKIRDTFQVYHQMFLEGLDAANVAPIPAALAPMAGAVSMGWARNRGLLGEPSNGARTRPRAAPL